MAIDGIGSRGGNLGVPPTNSVGREPPTQTPPTTNAKPNGWENTETRPILATAASGAGAPSAAEAWSSWALTQQKTILSTGWLSRDNAAADTFDYLKTLSVPDRTALLSTPAGKDLLVTLAEEMDDLDKPGDIIFDRNRIEEANQLIFATRFGGRPPRAPSAAVSNSPLAVDAGALRSRFEAAPALALVSPDARKTLNAAWDKAGTLEPRVGNAVRSELVRFLEDGALSPETRNRAAATLVRGDALDVESALVLLPALRAPLTVEAQRKTPDPVRLDAVKAWEEFTVRDPVNRPFLFVEGTGGKGSGVPGELEDITQSFTVSIWNELGLEEKDFAGLPPETQARLFEAAYGEGLKRLEAGLAAAKAAGKDDLLPSRAHSHLETLKRHPARAEIVARGMSNYLADARQRSQASYSVETPAGLVAAGVGMAGGLVSPLIALGTVATGAVAGNSEWLGFTRLQQSRADAYSETYRFLFEQRR